MTTVVVDARTRTMAADTQMAYHCAHVTKVWKVLNPLDGDFWLMGVSGKLNQGLAFRDWWTAPTAAEVEAPDMEGTHVLLLGPRGDIAMYADGTMPVVVEEKFMSIGSGSDYAMGALAAGATPAQAVKIASRYDQSTNNKVKVLKLEKRNAQ